MMIQVSGKSGHLAQKMLVLSKKMPKSKVESFRKANFDVNQECKIMPT